ncbi:hypothetical protein ALTERO38_51199 [Alteromonas sp. 38]|nr:hypothetical protein ALTER154_70381 [Alteromonas sp. 154]VXB64390.1 hypothetical protein ALTERO38_51199 [Alteromonas sp. 38]
MKNYVCCLANQDLRCLVRYLFGCIASLIPYIDSFAPSTTRALVIDNQFSILNIVVPKQRDKISEFSTIHSFFENEWMLG